MTVGKLGVNGVRIRIMSQGIECYKPDINGRVRAGGLGINLG